MDSSYRLIVINRVQDTHRLSHILRVCESLKVKPIVFEAVTSEEIEVIPSGLQNIRFIKFKEDLYFHDITKSDFPITYSMMATCISYRLLYETLLDDDSCDTYIIIEDDVLASSYALKTEGAIDKYVGGLPRYDIAFLDSPRYVSAEKIRCRTENHINYSCLGFGRNYTHAISKQGASKFISHFGKWIYKSHEDHLSKACCTGIFSHIMLPQNPIFYYTDNFPSTKQPSLNKIEWYSDKYSPPAIDPFVRNNSNVFHRFNYVKLERSFKFEAFWINVDAQLERAEFMVRELNESGVPHTRVSACTPNTLPAIDVQYNCYVSNLEYACMCSHIRAYQRALKSAADWFLVLEDDMIMYETEKHRNIDIYESLQTILRDSPIDTDCLQLFCSNPDVQKKLVHANIRGEKYIPVDRDTWGACAYFISREAAERLVKRYVTGESSIDFKSLTHPINPEAVVYTGLKCYSHTESIFTTREDIRSLVHQEHVSDHFYCNFIVRERLKMRIADNYHKKFVFIIASNSHTSGAYELANILNKDPYQHIETESHEMLPWIIKGDDLHKKLALLSQRDYPIVGDVGHYYINYVPDIVEICSDRAKIIYLCDPLEKSVNHFLTSTPISVNYWSASPKISSNYDHTYPTYHSSAKKDSAEKYCREFDEIAALMAEKYPCNFGVFSDIHKDSTIKSIYDFLKTPRRTR